MPDPRPQAEACLRNRDPILSILRTAFAGCTRVLEAGSGTGQHAVHMAANLPTLRWHCSDLPERLPGIRAWLDAAGLPNTPAPVPLDIAPGWPGALADAQRAAGNAASPFDAVFTANTLHILSWPRVVALFEGLPAITTGDAVLVAYGPFLRDGQASDSNRAFDAWLRARDADAGLRELREVDALAAAAGFSMVEDVPMPANNRGVTWRRRAG